MDRHQRCLAAIQGRPVDRLPAYLPAIACSVASALLGRPAHAGTGSLHFAETRARFQGPQAHAEFIEKMTQDLIDLHRMLDIDVLRMPWRAHWTPTRQIDEHTFIQGDPEGDHSVWRFDPSSGDYGPQSSVRTSTTPFEDVLRARVEEGELRLADIQPGARHAVEGHLTFWRRVGSEFFVPMGGGGICAGMGEEDLMALALEPELVARQMMLQARSALATGLALAASPAPAVMLGGGDLASQTGPLYAPDAFRRVLLPAYRFALQGLNPAGVHYVFRSDGQLGAIADMLFADAACPGFGETDRDAGMTIRDLRRRYPRLVVWGNGSSAFLQHATPAQARDHALRLRDEAGGSLCFHGPSNAITHGTPPDNVLAFFAVR